MSIKPVVDPSRLSRRNVLGDARNSSAGDGHVADAGELLRRIDHATAPNQQVVQHPARSALGRVRGALRTEASRERADRRYDRSRSELSEEGSSSGS
jgi:hypothetical protein